MIDERRQHVAAVTQALPTPRARSRRHHRPVPLEEDDNDNVVNGGDDPSPSPEEEEEEESFRDDEGLDLEEPPTPKDCKSDISTSPVPRWAYVYAGCAALNACNIGYDLGVGTDTALAVQSTMGLADRQVEFYLATLDLFATLGALLSHAASDGRWGRRGALAASCAGIALGIATSCASTSYGALVAGRAAMGLGVGVGMAVNPVYIAEMSPPEARGRLVSWSEIGINIGILLAFCTGVAFSGIPEDVAWRAIYGTGAVLPFAVLLLVIFVIPESPRWLMQRGREEEAREVLSRVNPEGCDVGTIAASIRESLRKELSSRSSLGWSSILLHPSPALRRMLLVGVGTAFCQSLSGIGAVGGYQPYILEAAGIKSRASQSSALAGLQLLKLGTIFVAAHLFDRMGRRPLLLASLGGMIAAMLLLFLDFILGGMGAGTEAGDEDGNNDFSYGGSGPFSVFCLALFLCSFSLGMGPGCWLVPSEVFSLGVRAKAMGLATFAMRLSASAYTSIVLSFVDAVSWGGLFLLVAAGCILVALFLHKYLPETRGRTLEEMTEYFARITNDRSILDLEGIVEERGCRDDHDGEGIALT